MQTFTGIVSDPDKPVDVPVPGNEFGPVTEVELAVTVIWNGLTKPPKPIDVVIKGCFEGM